MKNMENIFSPKPVKEIMIQNPVLPEAEFDQNKYRTAVFDQYESLKKIHSESANQFLAQESIKLRFKVAQELCDRESSGSSRVPQKEKTVEQYIQNKRETFDVKNVSIEESIPVLAYEQILQSPVYEYEKKLQLAPEKKIEMLAKIDTYLRERGIYTIFTDKIVDDEADIQKPWEIEEGKNYRDLPIAELVGNKILINPANVDFLSVFLSIGHIYGHLVQRTEPEEYYGITRFLEYPKPLDLQIIQDEYANDFGGEYKNDFKVYEEEAFAYAKYTFQESGIEVNPELEYAMRIYIEADFHELWKWSTTDPQKDASDFMATFTRFYDEYKGICTPLSPKHVSVKVEPDANGRIQVVRDGKV